MNEFKVPPNPFSLNISQGDRSNQTSTEYKPKDKKCAHEESINQLIFLLDSYQVTIFKDSITTAVGFSGISSSSSAQTTTAPSLLDDLNTTLTKYDWNAMGRVVRMVGSGRSSQGQGRAFVDARTVVKEILLDPLLSSYSLIVISVSSCSGSDSVMEDLLIALLKKILKKRADFRVLLVLDDYYHHLVELYSEFYKPLKTITYQVPVKVYQTQVFNLVEPSSNYMNSIISTLLQIEKNGDVLVYVPTAMISLLVRRIEEETQFAVCTSASLGTVHTSQSSVRSKTVIVSDRTCHMSCSIVIDSGFESVKIYNPTLLTSTTHSIPVTAATMSLRLKSASFLSPGICYRLYESSVSITPITNGSTGDWLEATLILLGLGCDISTFDYLRAPSFKSIKTALHLLIAMKAITQTPSITPLGTRLLTLPLPLLDAFLLLNGEKLGCVEECLTIVAMAKISGFKKKFVVEEGEYVTKFNVYAGFLQSRKSPAWCRANDLDYASLIEAVNKRQQLSKYVGGGSCGSNINLLLSCIARSLFMYLCRAREEGGFVTMFGEVVKGNGVGWVVAGGIHDGILGGFSVVSLEDLGDLCPGFYVKA